MASCTETFTTTRNATKSSLYFQNSCAPTLKTFLFPTPTSTVMLSRQARADGESSSWLVCSIVCYSSTWWFRSDGFTIVFSHATSKGLKPACVCRAKPVSVKWVVIETRVPVTAGSPVHEQGDIWFGVPPRAQKAAYCRRAIKTHPCSPLCKYL